MGSGLRAGDIVEFKLYGSMIKAILFHEADYEGDYPMACDDDDWHYSSLLKDGYTLIGHTDILDGLNQGNSSKAVRLAMDYFAAGSEQWAVGDVVEFDAAFGRKRTCQGIVYNGRNCLHVANTYHGDCITQTKLIDSQITNMKKIGHVDVSASADFRDVKIIAKAYFKRPYLERQAQWVKDNKVAVGTPVKVQRHFERNADGARCMSSEPEWKAAMIGNTYKVRSIEADYIVLDAGERGQYPQFPYTVLEVK